MKTLIDKLAAGVSTYEMPDAEVLENRIAVELETGDYKRGELNIKSKNNLPIKGIHNKRRCKKYINRCSKHHCESNKRCNDGGIRQNIS